MEPPCPIVILVLIFGLLTWLEFLYLLASRIGWSRALRAYTFKIPYDPGNHTVVLAATFDLNGGKPRLFDQIILEPSGRTTPATPAAPEAGGAQTRPVRTRRGELPPATQPATAPASPGGGERPDAVQPAQ